MEVRPDEISKLLLSDQRYTPDACLKTFLSSRIPLS